MSNEHAYVFYLFNRDGDVVDVKLSFKQKLDKKIVIKLIKDLTKNIRIKFNENCFHPKYANENFHFQYNVRIN